MPNRRFAISDIHGNHRTFLRALDRIELAPEDELYLLGDYVDRGPDSRGVINTILDLKERGFRIHCLTGNHEVYMRNALDKDYDERYYSMWLRSGGFATLKSYEIDIETGQGKYLSDLHRHLNWMSELPYYLDLGDYLLVHAGVNFSAPAPLEDKESLIQIRNWHESVDRNWLDGRTIVHGHTPKTKTDIIAQLDPDAHPYPVIDIDAGCFHWREGMGHLAVLDLDRRELWFFPNEDMPLDEIRLVRQATSA